MILGSIVPVFFVMALGYLAGWTRDIDNHHVAELTALVMDFAVPASLFVATAQTPRTLLLQQGNLIAVLAISMLLIYGLVFLLQRSLFKLDTRQAAVGSLTVAFPNLASAGLPLISSVFGAGHAVSVGVSLAVGLIMLSPLTLVLLETGEQTPKDVPVLRHIDQYDAATFERWNIVNRIVPDEALEAETRAFAARLANGPTLAYAAGKRIVRAYLDGGIRAADRVVDEVGPPLFESEDMQAGVTALLVHGPRRFRDKVVFEGR